MKNNPIDKGVSLIRKSSLIKFFKNSNSKFFIQYGYTMFFPDSLNFFRPIEKYLRWLPLGAQYYVNFRLSDDETY